MNNNLNVEDKCFQELIRIYDELGTLKASIDSIDINYKASLRYFKSLEIQSIKLNTLAEGISNLDILSKSERYDVIEELKSEFEEDILSYSEFFTDISERIDSAIKGLISYTENSKWNSYNASEKVVQLMDKELINYFSDNGFLKEQNPFLHSKKGLFPDK